MKYYRFEKINILEELGKVNTIEFENRKGSCNPSIKRLDFGEFYAYLIHFYAGCNCNYLGCENYKLKKCALKLRRKDNEEIITTNNGKNKLKLSIDKKYSIEEIKNLIIKNY